MLSNAAGKQKKYRNMINHNLLIGMPSLISPLEISKTLPFGGMGKGSGRILFTVHNDFVVGLGFFGEKYIPPRHNSKLQNLVTKT